MKPVIKVLALLVTFATFATVSASCVDYWDGTAPFCSGGPCKPGWHQTQTSKTGDGRKCWSGNKVYCQCDGPPANTCRDYWDGTAPLCNGGPCAPGYHQTATSSSGDGGFCFRGHKVYCQCDANTGGPNPNCVPTVPVKQTCVKFLLVCNNGCSTFACGFCFGSKLAAPGSTLDSLGTTPSDDLHNELLTTDNAQLREALTNMGVTVPAGATNDTVVDLGMQVLNQQVADLQTVNPAASFQAWEDTATWLPSEQLSPVGGGPSGPPVDQPFPGPTGPTDQPVEVV